MQKGLGRGPQFVERGFGFHVLREGLQDVLTYKAVTQREDEQNLSCFFVLSMLRLLLNASLFLGKIRLVSRNRETV